MAFYERIINHKTLRFGYLLEISGLPYRYYGGAVPDAEQIPGLSINYEDVPAINADVITNFLMRINPLESIPEVDGISVSLAPQVGKRRVPSDPIVVFTKMSHPSTTFIAQLTESVGLEPASEADPIFLKVDRDIGSLVEIDEDNGTVFYIHQEAFLVNGFFGDSADPQDDSPYRLRVIGRGARDTSGVMWTALRPHTVSPLVREYPDIQYGGCANWRTRHARLRITLLDNRGNRIGDKNKDNDPNSDYIDFIAGFIDITPRISGQDRVIQVPLKPFIAKLGSKSTFGTGATYLSIDEHYFHQYENEAGDIVSPATHLIGGLMINKNDTIIRDQTEYSFNSVTKGSDVGQNGIGDTTVHAGLQSVDLTWGNLLAPDMPNWHPRHRRFHTLAQFVNDSGVVPYIDHEVPLIEGGFGGFNIEPLTIQPEYAFRDNIPIKFPGGIEWKVYRGIEEAMLELIDPETGLPDATLPWPQRYEISQARAVEGVDGGWFSATLDGPENKFALYPTDDTKTATASIAPWDEEDPPPDDRLVLGDYPRGAKVNTPSFVWSHFFNLSSIKRYDPLIVIGGYFTNADDEDIQIPPDPRNLFGSYTHLYAPIWPYSDDEDNPIFATQPDGVRYIRNPSEGEGSGGGFHTDNQALNPSKVGWNMPITNYEEKTEWPVFIAKGFYQRGEKYILVDTPIIPDETGVITIRHFAPDRINGRSGKIETLRELTATTRITSNVQGVTSQTGGIKYLLELVDPTDCPSFCDWTILPDEIWSDSGLEKQGVVIVVGNDEPLRFSDYLYTLLTDPNSLGIPTDYVDRGAIDLLQERLSGVLADPIWRIPTYAGKLTIRDLIKDVLIHLRVALGVRSADDGKQKLTIEPADYQYRAIASASFDDSHMLMDPMPYPTTDERNLNRITIGYSFDPKGTPRGDRQIIVNSRLGVEEYDEVRDQNLKLYGIDRDIPNEQTQQLRQDLLTTSIELLRTWKNVRIAWRFSTSLQSGMKSLLGKTVLVTSDFLDGLLGTGQLIGGIGGVGDDDGDDLQPGISNQAGIVLEQNIDLLNSRVDFLVVQFPESNVSGWNAAVQGKSRAWFGNDEDDQDRIYVHPNAWQAFVSQYGTDQIRYDANVFVGDTDVNVYVFPVHKPDEGVETTVTSVDEYEEGLLTYYELVFEDNVIHEDDTEGNCLYIVEPLSHQTAWAAVLPLIWFADSLNNIGNANLDGYTYA